MDDERILELVKRHFDLRARAIIEALDLLRPIYRQTAAYGHFGRDDLDVPVGADRPGRGARRGRGPARAEPVPA